MRLRGDDSTPSVRTRRAIDDERCSAPGPCWCAECVTRFVREHPDGATLQELSDALGLTRQRIDQIARGALLKVRRLLEAE